MLYKSRHTYVAHIRIVQDSIAVATTYIGRFGQALNMVNHLLETVSFWALRHSFAYADWHRVGERDKHLLPALC